MSLPSRNDKPGGERSLKVPRPAARAAPESEPPAAGDGPAPAPGPEGHRYQPDDVIAQKYRLTRVLGEGGMGAVWLARNLKLDVDVAIKLIRHELGSEGASDRLLQEARAAARIGHRSIVRIFDFGETEREDPFIVMEVLTGESLRDVLTRKGRLPATNAVRTLLPIASALIEAHASGIVHRDLKPENVMLVPDKAGGVLPKLVDFGIAKFRRSDEHPDDGTSGRIVVGTPVYMAPEQAGGHDDVDEGADVWALAVILYEAITGRLPFGGPNYAALIFAIMTEEPTPTHEQMAGDVELWDILHEALAKLASARPSMRAFGKALAAWALARGIDSDVAGTSLAAHWLGDPAQSPFSAAPPPVVVDPAGAPDVVIPRPGAMPGGLRAIDHLAPTEAPPPDLGADDREIAAPSRRRPVDEGGPVDAPPVQVAGTRWRGAAWIAVTATVAGILVAVLLRGRAAPVPSVPAASGTVAVSTTANAAATVSAAATASAAAASAAAASAVATSTPVTSTAAPAGSAAEGGAGPAASGAPLAAPAETGGASAAASASGRPGFDRSPRRGRLPIAKHPNF